MQKNAWYISMPSHDKNSEQTRIERNCINIIKAIYEKPTANIRPNSENRKAFPLWSRTRWGCPRSLFLVYIGLKALPCTKTTTIRFCAVLMSVRGRGTRSSRWLRSCPPHLWAGKAALSAALSKDSHSPLQPWGGRPPFSFAFRPHVFMSAVC